MDKRFYDEIPDPMAIHPAEDETAFWSGRARRNSNGKGSVLSGPKPPRPPVIACWCHGTFRGFQGGELGPLHQRVATLTATRTSPACKDSKSPISYGNRFLVLGSVNFPRRGMLTARREGAGDDRPTLARLRPAHCRRAPVWHIQTLQGTLPPLPGVSVYTYADEGGKYGLVDDGFSAYTWT